MTHIGLCLVGWASAGTSLLRHGAEGVSLGLPALVPGRRGPGRWGRIVIGVARIVALGVIKLLQSQPLCHSVVVFICVGLMRYPEAAHWNGNPSPDADPCASKSVLLGLAA